MLTTDRHFTYHFFDLPIGYNFQNLILALKTDKNKNSRKSILQLIDPEYLVSERQIAVGLFHVEKVFEDNNNISNEKGTELLLHLAGKRQIRKALKDFGIKNNTKYIFLIAFGGTSEQNSQELTTFVQRHILEKYKLENIALPISPLSKLAEYYDSPEDITQIEKNALERMAYLALE